MTARPGDDAERTVATSGEPASASSSGMATSASTSVAENPGASAWTSTIGGANSGKTSSGASSADHTPIRLTTPAKRNTTVRWRSESATRRATIC